MFVIISNFSKEFLFWNGHPEYLLSFNQSKHSTKLIIQLVDEKKVSGPKYLLSLELVLRSYFDFEREMVKIKSGFFLLESTPWGHVLSLKSFCRNPVLMGFWICSRNEGLTDSALVQGVRYSKKKYIILKESFLFYVSWTNIITKLFTCGVIK